MSDCLLGNGRSGKDRYTLQAHCSGTSPSANNTYYYAGRFAIAAQTTGTWARIFIPATGTITAIYSWITATTLGSSANQTLYIRVNNTTDYLVANDYDISTGASNIANFGGETLSIAVTAGDYIEMKWVTPNPWATPGTSIYWFHTILIESTV